MFVCLCLLVVVVFLRASILYTVCQRMLQGFVCLLVFFSKDGTCDTAE